MPPSEQIGTYTPVSSKYFISSAATSITAVACPRPIPFCSLGNADGTSAYADLDKVSAGVSQESESFSVYHISGSHPLHRRRTFL